MSLCISRRPAPSTPTSYHSAKAKYGMHDPTLYLESTTVVRFPMLAALKSDHLAPLTNQRAYLSHKVKRMRRQATVPSVLHPYHTPPVYWSWFHEAMHLTNLLETGSTKWIISRIVSYRAWVTSDQDDDVRGRQGAWRCFALARAWRDVGVTCVMWRDVGVTWRGRGVTWRGRGAGGCSLTTDYISDAGSRLATAAAVTTIRRRSARSKPTVSGTCNSALGARRSALGARRSALGARRSALGARRSALGARPHVLPHFN